MEASSKPWQAEAKSLVANGLPMEAMKAVMLEMRAFSNRPCVLQLGIDTTDYYRDPAAFGSSMREAGAAEDDVSAFREILVERGIIWLSLGQPTKAKRDLTASEDMSSCSKMDPRVNAALQSVRKALEEIQVRERKEAMEKKVPVTILTGFLGSGKTTLLNYILQAKHGSKYAVIENEVGQIGIDNQLLNSPSMAQKTAEQIVLLDNGCLCCTVRSDLLTAVKQILTRANAESAMKFAAIAGHAEMQNESSPVLDGIIIETTGLADPAPVCKTFYADEELREQTRIDGVLTVVDAIHFIEQLRRIRSDGAVNESAQQVAFADKILLNKVDAVDEAVILQAEAEVRHINDACPIVRCSLASKSIDLNELLVAQSFSLDRVLEDMSADEGNLTAQPSDIFAGYCKPASRDSAKRRKSFLPQSRHDTGVTTCSMTLDGAPLVLKRFIEVMNTIRQENSVDLYRYKGVICVKEPSGLIRRAVLQGVQDICEMEPRGDWPDSSPICSQLVFIGRKLNRPLWQSLLEKCKANSADDGLEASSCEDPTRVKLSPNLVTGQGAP